MITRLQTIFLKHNKVLFSILLAVVVVTFVLTIGPQSFFGSSSSRQIESRNFFGYDINSERVVRGIISEAQISAAFHPELGIRRAEDIEQYAFTRIAGLGLARSLGVPRPTREAVESYVRSLPVFENSETGAFDSAQYRQYLDMLKMQAGVTEESLSRILRDDALIAQVRELLAGPSYVQRFEARENLKARDTEWTLKVARANLANFEATLEPTVEELRAFYEQNPARFALPERIDVSAVQFPVTNYLIDAGQPTEQQLVETFNRNKFRYQQLFNQQLDAEKTDAGETEGDEERPEVTLEDVRDTVVQDWTFERARTLAGTAAEAFTIRLWEQQISRDSDVFATAVQEAGARVEEVPLYSREDALQRATLPTDALQSMWIHTSGNRYFSDPALHRTGAVVLVFNKLVPAEQPAFEEVYDEVEQAWMAAERRRAFVEQGRQWREELASAVAQGQSFIDKASELGLETETPDAFKGANVPWNLRRGSVWDQVQYLAEGEISPMLMSGDQGTIVFVEWKEVPEVSENSPELAEYIADQRQLLDTVSGWMRLQEFANNALEQVSEISTQVE